MILLKDDMPVPLSIRTSYLPGQRIYLSLRLLVGIIFQHWEKQHKYANLTEYHPQHYPPTPSTKKEKDFTTYLL